MLFQAEVSKINYTLLYRFSVLSSIYICVVSMNLYYILCKYINQYNMLIHGILRILISMGYFPFRCVLGTDITGVFRSETPLLYFLTGNRRTVSNFHIPSTSGNTPVLPYFLRQLSGDYSPSEGVTFCVTP